jgi:nitrile hydratase
MSDHHHEHIAVEDRVRALESLLVEKGITRSEHIDRYLAWVESDIGPLLGARIVARAWLSPDFKARLLADAPAACAELGIDAGNRAVLREFGCELPEETAVRVWDSSSEVRYMVLPERPEGSSGMTEEELIALISRDALVGVARITVPARLPTRVVDSAPE